LIKLFDLGSAIANNKYYGVVVKNVSSEELKYFLLFDD
jgi:hypothetical protein